MEPFIIVDQPNMPTVLKLRAWEQFNHLSAGFTTRIGGVSEGVFDSLNCGLHVADAQAAVIRNRELIAEAATFTLDDWVSAEQVHGGLVSEIKLSDRGRGSRDLESAIKQADAMITQEPGIMLSAFYADCVPILLFDPEHDAIGVVHAGWKGTVKKIIVNTISAMQKAYNTNPALLLAGIAPSIGPCCYLVDEPVIEQVELSSPNTDAYKETKPGQYALDLKQLNRHFMIEAGVLPTNIECTTWCTGCHPDLFYSHRMENGQTGRMAAWVGIKRR